MSCEYDLPCGSSHEVTMDALIQGNFFVILFDIISKNQPIPKQLELDLNETNVANTYVVDLFKNIFHRQTNEWRSLLRNKVIMLWMLLTPLPGKKIKKSRLAQYTLRQYIGKMTEKKRSFAVHYQLPPGFDINQVYRTQHLNDEPAMVVILCALHDNYDTTGMPMMNTMMRNGFPYMNFMDEQQATVDRLVLAILACIYGHLKWNCKWLPKGSPRIDDLRGRHANDRSNHCDYNRAKSFVKFVVRHCKYTYPGSSCYKKIREKRQGHLSTARVCAVHISRGVQHQATKWSQGGWSDKWLATECEKLAGKQRNHFCASLAGKMYYGTFLVLDQLTTRVRLDNDDNERNSMAQRKITVMEEHGYLHSNPQFYDEFLIGHWGIAEATMDRGIIEASNVPGNYETRLANGEDFNDVMPPPAADSDDETMHSINGVESSDEEFIDEEFIDA